MLVKVKIKGTGKDYEYIANKKYKKGDKVIVGTYRNDKGVEATISETNVKRNHRKPLKRVKGRKEK